MTEGLSTAVHLAMHEKAHRQAVEDVSVDNRDGRDDQGKPGRYDESSP